MSLPALLDPRAIRAAVVLFLVAFALIASVAMAAAASQPQVLPVEPDGGIGGEIVLPVEPDGGIGN
jgi:membrane-bound ClpP family serine protease